MQQGARKPHRYATRKSRRTSWLLVRLLPLYLLTGCALGPPALRASFVDYSSAYADISNRQMLLNLARTANYHPAYFLQLGNITTTFQFGAEASIGAEAGRQRPRGTKITEVGAEAALAGSYGEQPTFDFTPLSGKSFAQVALSPIPRNVFFALYEQGFPADLLLRGLVLSVTFEFPESGRRIVLSNIADLDRPERFLDFLRLAAIMRELQLEQALFLTEDAEGNPQFGFAPEIDALVQQLLARPGYRLDADLGADLGGQRREPRRASLKMRTFSGALYTFATESQLFDAIAARDPQMLERVPASQRRPILRLRWPADAVLTPPVSTVDYLGKRYQIADPVDPELGVADTWNREAFSLLLYLYSQVSLDPSELPASNFFRVLP